MQRLAEALVCFIRTGLQPGVLGVSLRTLRILSRDRQALAPLITDSAILTLSCLGGIDTLAVSHRDGQEKAEAPLDLQSQGAPGGAEVSGERISHELDRTEGIQGVLERGKRDTREEEDEECADWSDDGEMWRTEALKVLCNVIYNSQRAQERASALR